MKTLSIDLETYSDVDLAKAGVYKYAESPNFEILLLGVSINDGPVQVYDLASGDAVPDELIAAIAGDDVIKWSFNASFERICLSSWLLRHYPQYLDNDDDGFMPCRYSIKEDTVGNYLNPVSWHCSMVLSAYNGLPQSLEQVGAVLGFDQQKLKEGKDLIRYFCVPCRPTKTNGGRTRNLPEHALDKWALFKLYNQRDVEVEMQIHKRLQNYPVPDLVWDEYHLSEEINDRGILIDRQLVDNAIRMSEITQKRLSEEMKNKTGLENPNSVAQLKGWLSDNNVETDSLGKKDVAKLIPEAPDMVAEVLRLRQQSSKSSIKKYVAMDTAACNDNRCRGMFRFYGANRTGRFAGRIVQLQNLYRNSMPDLAEARELVRQGDYESLDMLYDNIPDVLSQLIRTSFIPKPGYKYVVSDFSAIEARVLSFLAGEKWRLDVFAGSGDIYCESASHMFGVPVVKHGINGELRQKGKQAELACIAEGQLVLTDQGLVPIEKVTTDMKVWDGEEFVHHGGVVYKGEREVMTYEGLTATPDHYVWVDGEQEPVPFGIAAASGAHLVQTGNGRKPLRLGRNYQLGKEMELKLESLLCSDKVSRVRQCSVATIRQFKARKIKRLSALFPTTSCTKMALQKIDSREESMHKSKGLHVPRLWGAWHKIRIQQCKRSLHIFNYRIWGTRTKDGARSNQHQWELCPWQFTICYERTEPGKPKNNDNISIRSRILAIQQIGCDKKTICRNITRSDHSGSSEISIRKKEALEDHLCKARLYDIRNAGKHHRFTVSGHLVHNCGYGGSVGALKAMGALDMSLSEDELPGLVESWRSSNPNIVQYWWDIDNAVKTTIKQRIPTKVGLITFSWKSGMLFAELPSGRHLSYVKPSIGENQFGGESITYMGNDSTRHWSRIESYGPKIVENLVQAISRDILCYSMQTLSSCFIVGHVHDELIIECSPGVDFHVVCEQMGRTPPWIPGLLLRADGYECHFYQKD